MCVLLLIEFRCVFCHQQAYFSQIILAFCNLKQVALQFICVNHAWWRQKTAETCSSCECSINKFVLRLNRIWHKFVKYKICLTQYCFVTHSIHADLLTGRMEGSCHVFGQNFNSSTEKDRTEFLHVLSSQNSVAPFISKLLQSIPKME